MLDDEQDKTSNPYACRIWDGVRPTTVALDGETARLSGKAYPSTWEARACGMISPGDRSINVAVARNTSLFMVYLQIAWCAGLRIKDYWNSRVNY